MTPRSQAFDHLPRTAANHFQICFYAATYRVVLHLYRLAKNTGGDPRDALAKHPFLGRYFEEMLAYLPRELSWEEATDWWSAEIDAWEATASEQLPLRELTSGGVLSPAERDGLLVAGLIEEDSRFGTLFARLQAPLRQRRPSLELVDQIAGSGAPGAPSVSRVLLHNGLVEAVNPEAPRSEWQLRVPPLLWDSLRDGRAPVPAWLERPDPYGAESIATLMIGEDFRAQLLRLPALLESRTADAVVLRGMRGSERLECLGAIARAMGRGIAVVNLSEERSADKVPWSVLGPYCTLTRRMPVLIYDPGPGEIAEPPSLRGYTGPLGIVLGLEGGLSGAVADHAVTLSVPFPGRSERDGHWRAALEGQTVNGFDEIASRFQIPAGHIRTAGRMAIAYAQIAQRTVIEPADVAAATRQLNRQHLDTLAARVETNVTWDDVVLDAGTMRQLFDLEQRCRERERVLEHLARGFRASSGRGVKALFSGASGTGKTLAARVMAGELGLDLYRVDLGAVVNKYVGETEKNFHRVLSWAEELDVVLLLDEGDSVLGNRTEVKSANDRYANLETNYLLQRLETYQGIVFITTNAAQYIDSAFQRRMDVVVNFVPPQADERREVWRRHLPPDGSPDETYLTRLAQRFVMTGGQIRNAALHATTLAVVEDGGVVQPRHIEYAIQGEYRKSGALGPSAEADLGGTPTTALDSLVRVLG